MIVLADALVASVTAALTLKRPVILYKDMVTVSNIAATYANASYPVTNLANPQTSSFWKSGNTGTQYLTVSLDGTIQSDSMGVARHNWGSGLVTVSVEGFTVASGAWVQLVSPTLLGDDTPALFLFAADFYTGLRFKLVPGLVQPQAAVVKCGPRLWVSSGMAPGHTPINYGRSKTTLTARAMNGDYLGKIITSQALTTTMSLKAVDPAWYRAYIQPFIDADTTFFFAWNAADYPKEVGYAWLGADPMPKINYATGQVDVDFNFDGLAL